MRSRGAGRHGSALAAVAMVSALYGGLVLAPPDYQQKDAFRMVYVHAPTAWLSLMIYTTMAVAAAVGLIWRMKVAHAAAAACAPSVHGSRGGARHRHVVGNQCGARTGCGTHD
jgi:ABC-type transport system involved in cytochrome c biogenesis permease subunit